MVDSELRLPRRKKTNRNQFIESPFPIPIKTITNRQPTNRVWYFYFGTLSGCQVLIWKGGDIEFLYRLGFFGKGLLSRSKPQFTNLIHTLGEKTKYKYDGCGTQEEEQKIEAINKERLRLHEQWSEERKTLGCEDLNTNKNPAEFAQEFPVQYEDLCLSKDTTSEDFSTEGEDELQVAAEGRRTEKGLPQKNAISEGPLEDKEVDSQDENTETSRCQESSENEGGFTDSPPSKMQRLSDPYELKELLVLTLEEAFFLSFGLGCLTVRDQNKVPMTLSSMWKMFTSLKPTFIESYVVYHYFRSKGWVVRSGVMYGVDYVLYKDGMQFYHASYALKVIRETDKSVQTPWNWTFIASLNRVVENVAKELLICYVVKSPDLRSEDLESPLCITKFEVQEVLFRRWVPERFREKQL